MIILKDKFNYGFLPKALIKMHQYGDVSATPIDEHIYEGLHYLNKDNIRLHFTISNEHEKDFNEYVSNILKDKDNIEITYSFQKEKTDTLAVDLDNNPFKLKDRSYLYRPGGHGALIENLNDIHADIIFIKNIDNVTHQDRVKDTIDNKKKLASIGSTIKEQIDNYIKTLLNDSFNLKEIERFLKETLHINYKKELTKEIALAFLNRPLRVCGVVLNTGLVTYLLRWTTPETLKNGAFSGQILETHVFGEILKTFKNNGNIAAPIYYYRDVFGNEIDLIIESDGKLYPIEIKKTMNPKKDMAKSFKLLHKAIGFEIGNEIILSLLDKKIKLGKNLYSYPIEKI